MKTLVKLYIALTTLLILDVTLYLTESISLSGHLSDWLLFWIWNLATIALISLNIKKRWSKVYAIVLAVFTILTAIPMGVPFLTILGFATHPTEIRYKLNENISVETYSRSVMSMPKIVAIRSYGFHEKLIAETEFDFEINERYYHLRDAISIRQLNSNNSDSLKIEFKFEDGTVIRTMKPFR